jgi:hypothetical protein
MAEMLKTRSPLELSLREITNLHLRVHGLGDGAGKRTYELRLGKDGERKGTEIYLQVKPNGELSFSDMLSLFAEFTPKIEKKSSVTYVKA